MASTSVVFDILARDHASDKFDHLGRAVDGSGSKMSKFTGIMKTAGKAAAYGLGAGLVLAAGAAVKFTEAAIEDEAAANKLAGALERNAGATETQVAATEKWIAAQGRALGVTDDELRPALGALVTATQDVGKAQELAGLAMDVSAARGKSLQSVSEALMKAQNGNVAALARLGINTKDATGATISMEQAVARMSEQFGGAAATQAGTLQGKMDRLKLVLSETGETIGAKLIPIVTQLSEWILTTAVPAVDKFFQQWQQGIGTAGQIRGALEKVGNVVKDVSGFLVRNKEAVAAVAAVYIGYRTALLAANVVTAISTGLTKAHAAAVVISNVAVKAAAVASAVWTGAQWALNAALTANPIGLVIVGVAALAAGLGIAYAKSEKFRSGVNAVWGALQKFAGFTLGGLVSAFESVSAAAGRAVAMVQSLASWISSLDLGKVGEIAGAVGGVIGKLGRGTGGGQSIDVTNPGAALLASIVKGIDKGKVKLGTALDKLKSYIQERQDKLADLIGKRDDIVNAFKGFTSSIFGADTGFEASKRRQEEILALQAEIAAMDKDVLDGKVSQAEVMGKIADAAQRIQGLQAEESAAPKGLAALLAFQANAKTKAQGLLADVQSLIGKGISRDLLTELQGAGESGMEQINLLAQGTKEQILQANADQAATQLALQEAGLAVSAAQGIEAKIAQEERDIKLADDIRDKLQALLEKQTKNQVIMVQLDGRDIRWSLRRLERQESGRP
jgi:hypothetical protein